METKNTLKTAITIIVSVVFAVFFMWLALGDLDFDRIKVSIVKANYFWVAVATFFAMLAYWLRAVRWNYLLEPMNYKIQNSNAFWVICFGYLMNLTIPRSGEFARATALFGIEKVPVEKSFATIVVERVIDLCFMLFFLLLTFVFNYDVLMFFYDKVRNYQSDEKKELSVVDKMFTDIGVQDLPSFYSNLKIGILFIVSLLALYFVYKFKHKFIDFIKGILEGLLSVFKIKDKLLFFAYSAGIWGCYFCAAYFVCFALEETSSFTIGDTFLIITAGTLGMMVPTSGGAGSFHIAVKLGIAGIFVSLGKDQSWGEEVGLTYALISHTMQTVATLVFGLISIPVILRRRK